MYVCVHMETISDNTLHLKERKSERWRKRDRVCITLHKIYWKCCAFRTIPSMHFPIVNFNAYTVQLLCHSDVWMHILFAWLHPQCMLTLILTVAFGPISIHSFGTFMDMALKFYSSFFFISFGMLFYPSHLPYAILMYPVCRFSIDWAHSHTHTNTLYIYKYAYSTCTCTKRVY